MIKLAGMAAYTTCVDLGSLVWSEAYLPSPSVYECGGPIGRFLCQHLAMQLKRRERKRSRNQISCKKWFLAQKLKSKKLHKTYWIDITGIKIKLKSGKEGDFFLKAARSTDPLALFGYSV